MIFRQTFRGNSWPCHKTKMQGPFIYLLHDSHIHEDSRSGQKLNMFHHQNACCVEKCKTPVEDRDTFTFATRDQVVVQYFVPIHM